MHIGPYCNVNLKMTGWGSSVMPDYYLGDDLDEKFNFSDTSPLQTATFSFRVRIIGDDK